jgi:hypothetical protein
VEKPAAAPLSAEDSVGSAVPALIGAAGGVTVGVGGGVSDAQAGTRKMSQSITRIAAPVNTRLDFISFQSRWNRQ